MRLFQHLLGLLIGFCIVSFVHTPRSQAATTGAPFIVKPLGTQAEKGYFDLNLDSRALQPLQIQIQNTSSRSLTLGTKVVTATSNANGIVDYVNSGNTDPSLPYALSQLIKNAKQTITLMPKETKTIDFLLQTPSQPFAGVLAGGIHIYSKSKDQPLQPIKANRIKHRFTYTIATLLRSQQAASAPAEKFNLGKINLTQRHTANAIQVDIHNQAPLFRYRARVEGVVTAKGSKQPLYTQQQKVDFAPNTILPLPISLNKTAFKPGAYTLHLNVKTKAKNWRFTKNFVVSAAKAQQLNQTDAYEHWRQDRNLVLYLIIFSCGALTLIVLLIYLVKRSVQQRKQYRQNRRLPYRSN
ncbi:DUF916 and DUF3324 domain-containing protein [Lactobacillus sp. CC-MHH1034]|uniref:DUF916 and DUF3324 domain-containing protein n=1 Tax=Agrilactobacillus fermenti TaxID=2586909 RepID=UPI001E4BCFE7|nr:DUF916 and DUF3324 domain-containing protein [Agrilactobacillus fermenti]MCD2256530.1 DUF916 and DUF3324 domain-containing protein [Agrilactobacillus fermenti]